MAEEMDDGAVALESMEVIPGRMKMSVKVSHRMRLLFADFMAQLLDDEGVSNYVSFVVEHPTRGAFEMTAQRMAGKRPAVLAAEERARAEKAEAEVERLRSELAIARSLAIQPKVT